MSEKKEKIQAKKPEGKKVDRLPHQDGAKINPLFQRAVEVSRRAS